MILQQKQVVVEEPKVKPSRRGKRKQATQEEKVIPQSPQEKEKGLSYWAQITDEFERLEFVYEIGVARLRNLFSLVNCCPIKETDEKKMMESGFDEVQAVIMKCDPVPQAVFDTLANMNQAWNNPVGCEARSMYGAELDQLVQTYGEGPWSKEAGIKIARAMKGVNCFDLRDYGNDFANWRRAWQTYLSANPVIQKYCDPDIVVLAFGGGAHTGALPFGAAGVIATQAARWGMNPVQGSNFVYSLGVPGAHSTGFGGAMVQFSPRFFHFPNIAPPALI